MMATHPLVVVTQANTTCKWGDHSIGPDIKLIGNKLMCWYVKKNCGCNTNHTSNIHDAYEKDPMTFHLSHVHMYMMIINKSSDVPLDMALASSTAGTIPILSMTTSTVIESITKADNDVLYIKCLVALSGPNICIIGLGFSSFS